MKPETLNELALFAGAGGGILGGKLLGWRTVCAVEWDAYARDVLVARQNDGCLEAFPIWDDVQTFDGNPWRGRVDVVSGGFPCQDISAAGKGAGIEGERSGMWKHMARIIGEVLPPLVFVENSPMLVGRGLGTVLADLAEMGYDAEWGVVGAHHAAAPHKRDRIWIIGKLGYANNDGQATSEKCGGTPQGSHASPPRTIKAGQSARSGEQLPELADTEGKRCGETGELRCEQSTQRACGCCEDVPNPTSGRCKEQWEKSKEERDISVPSVEIPDTGSERRQLPPKRELAAIEQPWSDSEAGGSGGITGEWWATEPNVGRVAHGVAARVDRLRCLGNGQVSAVVPIAWNILRPTNNEIQ